MKRVNFVLKINGKNGIGYETLPQAFMAARKIVDKASISVHGPHGKYTWSKLLVWARAADVIYADGSINSKSLRRPRR